MNLLIPLLVAIFSISFYGSSVHATTFDLSSSEIEESFSDESSNCVVFDSEERIITINCKIVNLSAINNQLNDTDIIRSGGRTGHRYEGGDDSIIIGNNIHNLYFAFYSKGVGGMKMSC
jgi:hypothetical protein